MDTVRWSAAVFVTLAAAALPAQRPMSIDDIMDLRNVGSVAISPDGSRVLYTVSAWEHPAARDASAGDWHDVRSHV
jgi:hypothetical protein